MIHWHYDTLFYTGNHDNNSFLYNLFNRLVGELHFAVKLTCEVGSPKSRDSDWVEFSTF